jgi:hypothetical protein
MKGAKEPPKTAYTEDDMKAAWFNGYSTRNKEMRKAILVEADKHNSFLSEQAVSKFYERKFYRQND